MSIDVITLAKQVEDYVIQTRRLIHQNPERPWEEWETTKFIEDELIKMGLEPQRFDDEHTGLWCMIKGGKAGEGAKTIMLRADIDALSVTEDTGLPFASRNSGVMHACGHDSHAAMLLGAAKILVDMREELSGNVKLLFQAAEETAIGAKWYVEQGVMDDVDVCYGCRAVLQEPLNKGNVIAVVLVYLRCVPLAEAVSAYAFIAKVVANNYINKDLISIPCRI